MAEILSSSFKSDLNRLFVEDALANENYYVFVSTIESFDPVDSPFSKNEFLEKTLFGKQILNDDIHYMIKYYPWQKGLVYEEYDDKVDLTDVRFYAVVGPNDNDTGDYRVYKCLNNNNRAVVSNPPNYATTVPNQIYETADGYVWKYMYRITALEFEAYNAIGYIPLTDNFIVNPAPATGSEISDIVVENKLDNFGYIEQRGTLVGSAYSSGVMIIDPVSELSPTFNYYVGQYIMTTNTDGVTSRLFKIAFYRYNQATGNAEIRVGAELTTGAANPVLAGVTPSASFKIFPEVKIVGDGTGAVAVPVIVDQQITSITLLRRGSGYNNVSVTITDPLLDFDPEVENSNQVRASVRARLTPKGGHGYNLIEEFLCRHFSFYGYITAEDNTLIGDTNTYAAVGIVKTPAFDGAAPTVFDNRIAITTDDIGNVTANTTVIQLNSDNETVFSGVVHEVDVNNDTFYIAEYMGPYPNNSATGNGDTSLDLTLPFRNETGQTITINSPVADNVTLSPYEQRSGEVYFMEDFFPLSRTDLSREEFKFVLEL